MDGALGPRAEAPDGLSAEHFHADLIVGLPAGLRCQAVLGDDGRNAWVAEAFVGLTSFIPTVGAGVRHRFTLLHEGGGACRVSPGIDVYGAFWSGGGDGYFGGPGGAATALTADVDVSVEQTWGDRWGIELGLKAGAGAAFLKNDTVYLPVIGLYGGFHF